VDRESRTVDRELGSEAVGQELGSRAWIGVLGTKTGNEITSN